MVALAGALSFLIGAVDRSGAGIGFITFWLLLGISGLGLIYATYQLKAVFWGNTYKEVPSGYVVKKHEVELHSHYFEDPLPTEIASASNKDKTAKDLFAADFKDFLIEKYVNCATHNAQLNMDRANQLHEANRGILVSAGFAFLAFIVFTFGDLQGHDPAKVQLSAPAEVNILSLPLDCLTCGKVAAETCGNKVGCPTNERQETITSATPQNSANTPAGATDQGGREQTPTVPTGTKGALK